MKETDFPEYRKGAANTTQALKSMPGGAPLKWWGVMKLRSNDSFKYTHYVKQLLFVCLGVFFFSPSLTKSV